MSVLFKIYKKKDPRLIYPGTLVCLQLSDLFPGVSRGANEALEPVNFPICSSGQKF